MPANSASTRSVIGVMDVQRAHQSEGAPAGECYYFFISSFFMPSFDIESLDIASLDTESFDIESFFIESLDIESSFDIESFFMSSAKAERIMAARLFMLSNLLQDIFQLATGVALLKFERGPSLVTSQDKELITRA
jgi:hypothetical protein